MNNENRSKPDYKSKKDGRSRILNDKSADAGNRSHQNPGSTTAEFLSGLTLKFMIPRFLCDCSHQGYLSGLIPLPAEMEILGYAASLLMGILLGLIGGGGSILTVPILVYLFGTPPALSTAYSLFIVGITSLAGSFSHFKKGNVNLRIALIFGVPSLISVFLVRLLVLPSIPEEIFSTESFTLTKDSFILVLFAVLMVLAAWSMIRPEKKSETTVSAAPLRIGLIIAEGVLVGGLTGLVGAGGGFLIIPALVILTGMKMKEAVGTSLLIITMKSLIGFLGDVPQTEGIDYGFLLFFTAFAVAGILIGSNLSKIIDNRKLKPAFGWFVLITGVGILFKEIILNRLH